VLVRRSSMRPGRFLLVVAAFALAAVLGHFVGPNMVPDHHNGASQVAAASIDLSSGPGNMDGRSPDGSLLSLAGFPHDHVAGDLTCGAVVLSLFLLLLLRPGSSVVLTMPLTRDPSKIPPKGHAGTITSSHQKRLAILSVSRC